MVRPKKPEGKAQVAWIPKIRVTEERLARYQAAFASAAERDPEMDGFSRWVRVALDQAADAELGPRSGSAPLPPVPGGPPPKGVYRADPLPSLNPNAMPVEKRKKPGPDVGKKAK